MNSAASGDYNGTLVYIPFSKICFSSSSCWLLGAWSVLECVLFQFSVCVRTYDQSKCVRAARGPFQGLCGSRSVKLVDITPLGLITDIISFLASWEETTDRTNCSLISSILFFSISPPFSTIFFACTLKRLSPSTQRLGPLNLKKKKTAGNIQWRKGAIC